MRYRTVAWLAAGLLVGVVLLVAAGLPALPGIVRGFLIHRIEAATGRAATIDALSLDLRTGRLAIRGLRVADRDGSPLGTIERLDARIRLGALLAGHLRVRELTIDGSTVRVVRFSHDQFNISDIVRRGAGGGAGFDVTVERFALGRGTVLLEDRSVSPWRVWKSEDLTLAGRNLSTRRADGEADASSTIDGAPVSVRIEQLRLAPVHLRAIVRARDVDLALARIYLPANAPVVLDRGRLETTVTAVFDAREGLHVDVEGRIADAVVIRRFRRDPILTSPALRLAVRDFAVSPQGALSVARLELGGATTLVNPDASPPARFELPRVRVSAEALSWPPREPARVELASTVPGGGELTARGHLTVQPVAADLDVRLTRVRLAPWARYVAPALRVTGTGEAAIAVKAALQPALAATGKGTARLTDVVVTEGERRLLSVERAEAAGLDLTWPSQVALGRVTLRRPVAVVERDAGGALVLPPVGPARSPDGKTGSPTDASEEPDFAPPPAPPSTLTVAIGELGVENGTVTWRDASVQPNATIRLAGVGLVAKNAQWPLARPVPVHLQARTPGGGSVAVAGEVGVEPVSADVRITARGVDLAPYRAYLPGALPVGGRADARLAATLVRAPELQARVKGDAALARLSLVDGKRKTLTAERIEARGLDVDWPSRLAADRIVLRQPWVLVERNESGSFPLLATLRSSLAGPGAAAGGAGGRVPGAEAGGGEPAGAARAFAVREIVVRDGGARIVDRSVSPAFSDDVSGLWMRLRRLASGPAKPARLELRARLGPAAPLTVRGSVGPLDGPLSVDVSAELRDLAATRLNPYLRHFVGWNATQGRVSTAVTARVAGDELEASTRMQIGQMKVVRASPDDAAQARLGLPLGLAVALLKDRHGDIELSLPVGGRLSDPQFDFRDAMWSAVRAAAIKTIALPVSWIGRLRFTADSKVEDVDIDPAGFEAGTATPSPEAAARLERLAGFMQTLPDTRIVVTPLISLGDLEILKERAVRARIKAAADEIKASEAEAARRLYVQFYNGADPPEAVDDIVKALREIEPPPADAALALARERADFARKELQKAGVEGERIALNKEAGALETYDPGRVDFGLTDQLKPRRSLLDLIKELLAALQRRLEAARPHGEPSALPRAPAPASPAR